MKWREIFCPWREIRRMKDWMRFQRRANDDLLNEINRMRHLLAHTHRGQARDSKGRFVARTKPTP